MADLKKEDGVIILPLKYEEDLIIRILKLLHIGTSDGLLVETFLPVGVLSNTLLIKALTFTLVLCRTPERQLRLFDIRLRQTEIHAFGWKQESSESQSALINQAWSPDGLYIASGSADPKIHIFDIRYNSQKPSQSIKAHQKRVFKAVWLRSVPLLVSISSDLNIGLHKTT